jgi:hypothetical protein
MGYIQEREQAVLMRIASARQRTREWRVGSGMQRTAQTSFYREMEELDRIHRALKSFIPNYHQRFIRCSSCGNTFNEESSYLAHWQYGLTRAIECVRAPSLLEALGFRAETYQHHDDSHPMWVYQHSSSERTE